jgi:hypothetical protein
MTNPNELPLDAVDPTVPLGGAPAPAPAIAPAPQKSPADIALADPSFAAFVMQRKAELDQLRSAQGQATKDRRWADVGNDFVRAGDTAMGKQSDESALQAKLDATNRPVTNLLQQQQYSQEATKGASADVDLQGKFSQRFASVSMMDPTSQMSKHAQLLAVAQGLIPASASSTLTADQYEMMLKGASLQEAKREHDLRLQQEAKKAADEAQYHRGELGLRSRALEQGKYSVNPQTGQLFNTTTGAILQGGGAGKLSRLPDTDSKTLEAVLNGIDATETVKKARSGPNDSMAAYGATRDAQLPAIAAAESGSGRASSQKEVADRIPGYVSPFSGDTFFDQTRSALIRDAEQKIADHKQRGYDVAAQEARLQRSKASGAPGGAPMSMRKVLPPGASVPVMVPESDVQHAIAAGGKLVP